MSTRALLKYPIGSNLQLMKPLLSLVLLLTAAQAQPSPGATTAFTTYVATVESHLTQQHRTPETYLAPEDESRLRQGEFVLDQLAPPSIPGAILHHWRGTAFAPGATAADFERLLKDFNAYPQHYAPEVLDAKVISQRPDLLQASMRVRQHHILTVVMDTTYDITFARLDPQHGASTSRSTRVSEIDSAGRALSPQEEHGFLYRLNTYWSYAERDGGLYLQIESVSLTRAIPHGLGWAVQPFLQSIPRESLEFTLRSTVNALKGSK